MAESRSSATADRAATRPTRLSGVEEHPLDDELLVYALRSETAYALNRSAAAIWQLSDGTRTIEEITEELGRCVGRPGTALLPDIIEGVTRLRQLGLLELR